MPKQDKKNSEGNIRFEPGRVAFMTVTVGVLTVVFIAVLVTL